MGEKKAVKPEEEEERQGEDEIQYPPRKAVIPAMVALALAFFLIALVCISLPYFNVTGKASS